MKRPVLILISGPPAAGKTTISRRLAEEFRLPLVAKDDIKETLFDTLGVHDLAWTRELGRVSIALLWQFVETLLRTGHSLIAESNFHAALDSERLAALQERHDFVPWQIHCTAPAPVLWARAVAREHTGARHPGHRGILMSHEEHMKRHREEFESNLMAGVWGPPRIAGKTLTVDTANWASLNWMAARAELQAVLDLAGQSVSEM